MTKFKIGVIQLDSQDNKKENLECIEKLITEAVEQGCKAVAMPENSNYVGLEASKMAEEIPGGETFKLLSKLAKNNKIWIHSGSIYETRGESVPYNTSFIVNPDGELVTKYNKVHPFDVKIKDGPDVKESDRIQRGENIVTVDTKEFGVWGLSICYDMRFPELYRLMTLEGANVLFVPADFTMNTGKDHWEVLLRARAIENGCYVVAPGQIGIKPRFQAYGKSLIIDPWGNVISKASDIPCLITAQIDLDYVEKIRNQIGTLSNRRTDLYKIKKL